MKHDFATTAAMMSGASLLDFAEGTSFRAGIAKSELRRRVKAGRVNDLDYDRAVIILGLA